MKRIDPVIDTVLDNFFAVLVARAPKRPTLPDCERITLHFGRMRQRWKKREPIPRDTKTFAFILQKHGVHVFAIQPGYIECEAAQRKIAKALGS